jgi:hypothetical protein
LFGAWFLEFGIKIIKVNINSYDNREASSSAAKAFSEFREERQNPCPG